MRNKFIVSFLVLVMVGIVCYNVVDSKDKSALVNVDDISISNSMVNGNNNYSKVKKLQEYYNNPDIKAIVSIEGNDSFNYPVVQASGDNDYYLSHDYYKNEDAYGVVSLDYRVDFNSSKKILIYGHSSVKRDAYFNSLENYYDKSYYDDNKYILLETDNGIRKYEVFSVYVETCDFTYMNMNFNGREDWYSHLVNLKSKSMYDTGVEIGIDDEVLIMQTCSNNSEYKNYSKKYLLVIAKRIDID